MLSRMTLNHAMIYVTDVERSIRFYVEALGMKPLAVQLPYYARLKSPQGTSTIALHQLEPGMQLGASIRLYFETPELAEAVKRVKKAGFAVKSPPKKMPWGWTHAYVDDPDGYEVSLYWSGGLRTKKA
jgi:catechol 2,3-dioxygenase-like lactoylglutathione lyase family enzyme